MIPAKKIIPLLFILFTPFFLKATNYYINDASLTGDVYTTAIGNDANPGTPTAPFATLGYALTVAVGGDNIYIDAGNYAINTTMVISLAVNIYGPNKTLSGYSLLRTTEAVLDFSTNPTTNLSDIAVVENTAAINIQGLTIRDDISTLVSSFSRNGITIGDNSLPSISSFNHVIQNNIFERNNANLNAATKNSLIYAIYVFPSTSILIDNNYFHGLSSSGLFNNSSWRSGTWVNPNNSSATISNNHYLNIRSGMNVNLNPALTIIGNNFDLGLTGTTAIATGGSGAGSAYTLATNNFTGFGIYISLANGYSSSFIMDATACTYNGNAFSTLNQTDGLIVEASLKHGNQTGLNGFIKIKPGNVYVTPVANGDNPKFIQKTIDNFAVSGDIVNIGTNDIVNFPANYKENIVVNKSVTLLGQGQSIVTLFPATSNPNCNGGGSGSLCSGGTLASNVILVQANDVSIKNLTIDGDNTSITSGQVFGGADIDARNGIITDQRVGTPFNNLLVDNVLVKNIFLRGIYASSNGSFIFNNNTVTNVQADPSSIAIFNYGGAGTFSNNTVSNANDGIVSNWSKGSTYTGNTVTNSGGGIHTDNNGGFGGTADLIQNNTISNSPAGGYGIFVFAPYLSPLVNSNTITNVEVGLANFGQNNAAASPTFTNNTIDAQNKANSIGIFQTTDQVGFGSNNVMGTFASNFIQNNTTAISVQYQAGYTNTIAVINNSITGNATGVNLQTGGVLVNDFTCNWWGSAIQSSVIAAIGAANTSLTFSPWLSTGTDNDAALAGFQMVPGSCNVILPVFFEANLTGNKLATANQLQWKMTSNNNILFFEIERSNDGINFIKIANLTPLTTTAYSFNDNIFSNNLTSYYRLKVVENSGTTTYSNTIILGNFKNVKSLFFPTPFSNYITILPSNIFTGNITISLYSMLGEHLFSKNIYNYNGGASITLNNLNLFANGVYKIVLRDNYGHFETQSVLKK